MSAATDRTAEIQKPGRREIIVDFLPEKVKAPFLLRCGALLIDYIIVVAVPVIGLLLSRVTGGDGAQLLSGLNSIAWFIAIFVAISNLLLLPMFSGQTLGKIFTGLRIVRLDGRAPTVRAIAIRQTLGYLITFLTGGLGFVVSGVNARGRALHDYISGTIVIFADRRVRR
ncbi:MAG TPA: RDD family protein [Pyrinomonadaceae bacterium]